MRPICLPDRKPNSFHLISLKPGSGVLEISECTHSKIAGDITWTIRIKNYELLFIQYTGSILKIQIENSGQPNSLKVTQIAKTSSYFLGRYPVPFKQLIPHLNDEFVTRA